MMANRNIDDASRAAGTSPLVVRHDGKTASALADRAAMLLKDGHVCEAIEGLREVLRVAPDNALVHNNLGVALGIQQEADAAIDSFRQAIALMPDYRDAYVNLGDALRQQERLDEAGAAYRNALLIDFADVDAHNALGIVYLDQRMFDEARGCFEQALAIDAASVSAHNNLGLVLLEEDRPADAIEPFARAIRLDPNCREAYRNRARAYQALGQYEDVAACYQELAARWPNNAEARNDLGAALHQQGQHDEAEEAYARCIELNPDMTAAYINAANLARELGDTDSAIARARNALAIDPSSSEAHVALGNAFSDQREIDAAMKHFDRAIDLREDKADAHMCRAMLKLRCGDWEEGWPEFEWRWRTERYRRGTSDAPRWIGQSLRGRTILVRAEGGLGDTLQFARYLRYVKQTGGTVIFVCDTRLHPLLRLASLGIDELCGLDEAVSAHDFQASLMSLPGILRTHTRSVPQRTPYLLPAPEAKVKWQRRLADIPSFRVGICWQGNPAYHRDKFRSAPTEMLEHLVAMPGVSLISLQSEPDAEAAGVLQLDDLQDELSGAFMETAAVIANLDLVISVDTAIGHLAGALGKRTWLALDYASDWRWLLDRPDTPWYPHTTLFRQQRPGDWHGVFNEMAGALANL